MWVRAAASLCGESDNGLHGCKIKIVFYASPNPALSAKGRKAQIIIVLSDLIFTGKTVSTHFGLDRAYLWTDSRYTLQATAQLDADLFEVHTILQGDSSVAITQWLAEQAALKIFGSQQAC